VEERAGKQCRFEGEEDAGTGWRGRRKMKACAGG